MRVAGWAGDYVGIPFAEGGRDRAGCDCWGLVRLVLGVVFGVEVPSHAGRYDGVADHEGIAALVEQDTKADDWVEVERAAARPGDVVLLRMRGLPIHVGIFAGPGLVLHTLAGTGAILTRVEGVLWRSRVLGVYRHRTLVEELVA